MKKGKSISKDVKLNALKQQGVDYNALEKHYFCNHCEVTIDYQNIFYAKRHV